MKHFRTGLALCSLFCTLYAAGNISGRVADTDGNPVEFANVVVINKSDSTYITGTVTGQDGTFSLSADGIRSILRVACLGFEDFEIDNPSEDVGTVTLVPTSIALGEVTVRASRPVARIKGDALVVGVQDTYLATSGTALDVLGKMPFVQRSGTQIEVIGKGSPLIYINGRQVRNDSELEQLASAQIKNVEVVTNPGSRYDASVNAVIRITTVAPVGEGFSLNDRTTLGYKHYAYLFEQVDFNYRKRGLDLFGMLDYENYRERSGYTNDEVQHLAEGTVHNESYGSGRDVYPVYAAKAGVNYQFNERQQVGLMYDFSFRPSEGDNWSESSRWLDDVFADELANRTNSRSHERSHLVSGYWQGRFADWQADVNLDAMWRNNDATADKSELSAVDDDRLFSTFSDVSSRLLAGKATVAHPLWKGSFLVGAEVSDSRRSDLYYSEAEYITDSDTRAEETTVAAFGEISQSFGRLQLTAGLRYEHTSSRYFMDGIRQTDESRGYSDLFPSAAVSYPVGDVNLRFEYSRKISRPAFAQLRSAVTYHDRYTYESGNPYLKPIYRDYVSITAQWRDLTVMLDYTSTDNYFMWQTAPYAEVTGATLLQMQNMPRYSSYSAMADYAPTFGLWHPQIMAGISVQDFSIEHNGGKLSLDKPIGIVRFNNAIHLPFDIWFNADFSYRTAGNGENIYIKSNWQFDLSLYKSFGNDTWSVKLALNDVFDTWRQEFTMYDAISRTSVVKTRDTRDLQLTVRYKFNSARSRYRGTGAATSERDRL